MSSRQCIDLSPTLNCLNNIETTIKKISASILFRMEKNVRKKQQTVEINEQCDKKNKLVTVSVLCDETDRIDNNTRECWILDNERYVAE